MDSDTQPKHHPFRRKWSIRRFWARSQPRYVTIPEASKALELPEATIIGWLNDRELSACKIGYHPEPFIDLQEALREGLIEDPYHYLSH
jgi:hypothetical protein